MSENDNVVFLADYLKSKRSKTSVINQDKTGDPIMDDYYRYQSTLYKKEFEDRIEYYDSSMELDSINYIDPKTRHIHANFNYYKGKIVSISKYFYNEEGLVCAMDHFLYKEDTGELFQREHLVTVIDELKPCFIERFRDGKPSRFIYYKDDHENVREIIEFRENGSILSIETREPNRVRTDVFEDNVMMYSVIHHLLSDTKELIDYSRDQTNSEKPL